MANALVGLGGKAYGQGKRLVRQSSRCGLIYKLMNWRKDSFVCPICCYRGPFRDQLTPDTIMRNSFCPKCSSMERHRLQYLVMKTLRDQMDFSQMAMLHVAPEQFFRERFGKWFRSYT